MGDFARELTIPKPDVVFGSFINRSSLESQFFTDQVPSMFSLDHRRLARLLSMPELSDVSCGTVGEGFCFPTLVIERKGDYGPLYDAQNQILGALRCMFEAQTITKRKVDKTLPVLPLGIVNIDHWIEFWACYPSGTAENVSKELSL